MNPPAVGVGGVILRADQRVLIIRRAHPPKIGSWSLPGGKVRGGEGLREALARELFEETSLQVRVGPVVDVVEIISEGFHYVVIDYLCTPLGNPDAARAGDDAADLQWVTEEQLRAGRFEVSMDVLRVVARAMELLRSSD